MTKSKFSKKIISVLFIIKNFIFNSFIFIILDKRIGFFFYSKITFLDDIFINNIKIRITKKIKIKIKNTNLVFEKLYNFIISY